MKQGFLHQYFLNNPHKRLHKWFHYFDIYERHFDRFREKKPVILEIGVKGGGSLMMWKAYFGVGAQVIGLDIDPACARHANDGFDIFIGSQDDPCVLGSILKKYPRVDIVIDDGGHVCSQQTASFLYLYSKVSEYGVYLVEDVHTSYWEDYGGGLNCAGSFVEFAKSKIDEINACHHRGGKPSGFTRSTDAILFYDSVVVFEKRPQGKRQARISGPMLGEDQ